MNIIWRNSESEVVQKVNVNKGDDISSLRAGDDALPTLPGMSGVQLSDCPPHLALHLVTHRHILGSGVRLANFQVVQHKLNTIQLGQRLSLTAFFTLRMFPVYWRNYITQAANVSRLLDELYNSSCECFPFIGGTI